MCGWIALGLNSLVAVQCKNTFSRCAVLLTPTLSCRLDDSAKGRTPPAPSVVRDNVGRVGDERSVVCVELARLVRRSVVVRVTDRWHRAVVHAVQTKTHLERARHFVDHPPSSMILPQPTWVNINNRHSVFCCQNWLYKKLSYCWETVRRESMPRIAEMDVEMTI